MDSVNHYREVVKTIISQYASVKPAVGDIKPEIVFDEERDHYELLYNGRRDWERVHGSVIHIDLIDGKFWIQHDGTGYGVANDLLDAGIPPDHIVLAFQHPERRKLSEFAVT